MPETPVGSKLLLGAVLLALGCAEAPTGLGAPGTLVVSTVTRGSDPDLDGYLLSLDGAEPLSMPGTDADTLVLEPGRHSLVLTGVAEHCSVAAGSSWEGEVVSGRTTTATFEISCPLTGLRVSLTTSGESLDRNGYVLLLDGSPRGTIEMEGTRLVSRLPPGPHSLSLGNLAVNCTSDGPRDVTVVAEVVVEVELSVTCVEPLATLRVTAPTSGPAAESFEVLLSSSEAPWDYDTWISLGRVPANGELSAQVAPGTYRAQLSGLYSWAYYCSVGVANPTGPFSLTHGSVMDLVFPVTCAS